MAINANTGCINPVKVHKQRQQSLIGYKLRARVVKSSAQRGEIITHAEVTVNWTGWARCHDAGQTMFATPATFVRNIFSYFIRSLTNFITAHKQKGVSRIVRGLYIASLPFCLARGEMWSFQCNKIQIAYTMLIFVGIVV